MDSISELSNIQVTALGRFLPTLLCGEESALQVFSQEGCRISNVQASHSRFLAYRIAADELEHERLIQELRGYCPVPDDIGYEHLCRMARPESILSRQFKINSLPMLNPLQTEFLGGTGITSFANSSRCGFICSGSPPVAGQGIELQPWLGASEAYAPTRAGNPASDLISRSGVPGSRSRTCP
jgi:hypothetical protein